MLFVDSWPRRRERAPGNDRFSYVRCVFFACKAFCAQLNRNPSREQRRPEDTSKHGTNNACKMRPGNHRKIIKVGSMLAPQTVPKRVRRRLPRPSWPQERLGRHFWSPNQSNNGSNIEATFRSDFGAILNAKMETKSFQNRFRYALAPRSPSRSGPRGLREGSEGETKVASGDLKKFQWRKKVVKRGPQPS